MAVRYASAGSAGAGAGAPPIAARTSDSWRGGLARSAIATAYAQSQSQSHASVQSLQSLQHLEEGGLLEGRGSSTPQQQHQRTSSGDATSDGSGGAATFSAFSSRLPRLLMSAGRMASAPASSSCSPLKRQASAGCHSPMRAAGGHMAVQRTPTKHTAPSLVSFSPLAASPSTFSPSHHHQGHPCGAGPSTGGGGGALLNGGVSDNSPLGREREEQRKLAVSSISNLTQLRDTVAFDADLPPRDKQVRTQAWAWARGLAGLADAPPPASPATLPCASEGMHMVSGGGGGAALSRLRRSSNGPLSPDSLQSSSMQLSANAVASAGLAAAAAVMHAGGNGGAGGGAGGGVAMRPVASDGGSQGSSATGVADRPAARGAAASPPAGDQPPLQAAQPTAMELGAAHSDAAGLASGSGGRIGPTAASMGVTLLLQQRQAPLDVRCSGLTPQQQRRIHGAGAPGGSPMASQYSGASLGQQGELLASPGVAAHQQQRQQQQQQYELQQQLHIPYPFPGCHLPVPLHVPHPHDPHYHSYQHQASLSHPQPDDLHLPHAAPLPARRGGASSADAPDREPHSWHLAMDIDCGAATTVAGLAPGGAAPFPSPASSIQAVQPLQQRDVDIAAAEGGAGLLFNGSCYEGSGGSSSGGLAAASVTDANLLDSMLENLLAEELPSLGLDTLTRF
ncbi:hypothetical protein TSOC_003523 [Tetrabaena socialis]|uniref:Uncharacterized protein n=1 Tax=Tetrabaena socialis TaxID=47790 RepID=A0A2J8ABA7_9CHLO|nr:hypothetical protein TSOC_003523 [Tetrabaena socialis]|eukprot:PNH09808.1 hypothetical protein TSOC_003523 [Tetrabaena socialis]